VVFKIQANLDPRHRDRVPYVRVCAGRFNRDMEILNSRTGELIRVKRSQRLFARERETLEVAYPGDVVGLVIPGQFRLGDTLSEGECLRYEGQWDFPSECFATLRCVDNGRRKQFNKGLHQLVEEGTVQVLRDMTLFAACFALRLLGPGALALLSSNMLAHWFHRRLRLVEGIRNFGMAGAMAVIPALNLWLLGHLGWRGSYAALGIGVWAGMLPLTLLFFRERPEDVGQQMDGARFFGVLHLGKIRGTMSTVNVGASSLGPLLFGVSRDMLGSHDAIRLAFTVVPLPLMILSCFATPPERPGNDD
jgi:hypothetical protein